MTASESDLLEQAVNGDNDALSDLLKRHLASVRRAISGRVPHRWRSLLSEEDVVQETFADAFHDIRRFDLKRDGSFSGWLSSLAKCNLHDAIRMLEAEKRGGDRKRVEVKLSGDSHAALIELLSSDGSTPSRHAAHDEARSVLDHSISKLPPDYRKVVRMYDLEGESIEKTAAALGRSHGAVYMLRARAHDWLRELMGAATNYFSDSP